MNYKVTWSESALQQYLALWTSATDPDTVDAAANRIDSILLVDAEQQGEGRSGNERILFDSPLVVLFAVFASERIAYVLSVRWYGPRD